MARRAHQAHLAAFALTDHDTTAGVAEAAAEGTRLGVRVITGCEFSVKAGWGELHLLGYFLPPGDPAVEAFLERARAGRRRRGEQMVARLQQCGIPVEIAAVERHAAGGALCRPHVARALVDAGASADVGDAFDRWIGRGRPAYVEKVLPCFGEVAALVHGAAGVAVAAHLGERASEGQVRQFKDAGLDGVEVRHPSHSPAGERRLLGIAQRLGLAITGGSDWHGETEVGRSHAPLGGLQVPAEWLERLQVRRVRRSGQGVT